MGAAETTPSSASPRLVFVVSRSCLALYRQLSRAFRGSEEVETILDRRADGRGEAPPPAEWTAAERRGAAADPQLDSPGWFIAWRASRPAYREIFESLRVAPAAPPGEVGRPSAEPGAPAAASIGARDAGDVSTDGVDSALDPIGAPQLAGETAGSSRALRAPASFPESGPTNSSSALRVAGIVLLVGLCGTAGFYGAMTLWAARAGSVATTVSPRPGALGPAPATTSAPPTRPEAEQAAEPEPARPAAKSEPGAEPPTGPPENSAVTRRAAAQRDLRAAFSAWVDAANRGQVASHVAWYADPVPAFYTAKNVSRSAVATARRKTFADTGRTHVRVGEPEIHLANDDLTATMVFTQTSRFEGPRANRRAALQELTWKKTSDGWRIVGERTLRELGSAPAAPPKHAAVPPKSPVTLPKRP